MSDVKVIIIEDDALVARALSRTCQSLDYEVVETFLDPDAALKSLSERDHIDPCIIMCDMDLGPSRMSGRELFLELRKIRPLIAERIIFVSAGSSSVANATFLESSRWVRKGGIAMRDKLQLAVASVMRGEPPDRPLVGVTGE